MKSLKSSTFRCLTLLEVVRGEAETSSRGSLAKVIVIGGGGNGGTIFHFSLVRLQVQLEMRRCIEKSVR